MFPFRKHHARRAQIRESRPDQGRLWRAITSSDVLISCFIALLFCLAAIAIVMLREDVVRFRPGQYTAQDILSRVDFQFTDRSRILEAQNLARELTPRRYKATDVENWILLRGELLRIPDRLALAQQSIDDVPADLKEQLQLKLPGDLALFQNFARPESKAAYEAAVEGYVAALKKDFPKFLYITDAERDEDLERPIIPYPPVDRPGEDRKGKSANSPGDPAFRAALAKEARVHFANTLGVPTNIVAFTLATLKPTYVLDESGTTAAQNDAASRVPESLAQISFKANQVLVHRKNVISERDGLILRAEQKQFITDLGNTALKSRLGLAALVALLTMGISIYIARYQPRVIHNHLRALAIAVLMLSTLLLAELAAIGTGPLYIFGIAPTLLVAMILAIAYDQRFALGLGSIHAIMVTAALDQGIGFYLILWAGVLTCCSMLREVRSRSRLIEVGGMTALVMILATVASGGLNYDPIPYINKNCLYVAAAGLGVGFVVLGILPFIERAFRITTGISLLELADASHPMLRRLAMEAPGTYNHSIQVAVLAEAAAESIGANSLLTRVGSYYHDIGKVNKAEYFVENQVDGRNRHINLSPNVSLLIIRGHVKDGMELAKEYNLPTVIAKFIEQHHGTTLVEYFYHQAVTQQESNSPDQPISDTEYRYSGPRPRSREIAICMIADCVESATRAMVDPNPSRIESLVRDLMTRRLLDGQFDECSLTFKELEIIRRTMVKMLMGIHHGRMEYPSTAAATARPQTAIAKPA